MNVTFLILSHLPSRRGLHASNILSLYGKTDKEKVPLFSLRGTTCCDVASHMMPLCRAQTFIRIIWSYVFLYFQLIFNLCVLYSPLTPSTAMPFKVVVIEIEFTQWIS